ncbi:MAG: MTAP family purine nucleoside phosphorylase [Planctomycetes bacterium]|nr:MTAP family purine nucleoside phosphorylase [Planctomycetota bacterium]
MDDVKLAVIGGSGAYTLLKRKALVGEEMPARETPFGMSQPMSRIEAEGAPFLFLSRHGQRRYTIAAPFVNYRANIYALKDLGVEHIVSWSGPGTMNEKFLLAQFVVIEDVIDETRNRTGTFFENNGLGFIRQNPVFCPTLRSVLMETLQELNWQFAEGGTYVCTEGPRLETPAEIRKMRAYGGDLVGMTLCPEVFLARELEMCYAAICYVSNYAEGVVARDYRAGELFEGLLTRDEMEKVEESVAKFPGIIQDLARRLNGTEFKCNCRKSMERYRVRGDIGTNWREWFRPSSSAQNT